jgi:hypothetical protein
MRGLTLLGIDAFPPNLTAPQLLSNYRIEVR